MEEQTWIRQAKRGDPEALARLFQKYYLFLVKALTKMTLQPDVAEELAQETMTRCVEKIHLYHEKAKFSSWLMTIATRLYIDQCRKVKHQNEWIQEEQYLVQWRGRADDSQEDWLDVLDALARLNREARLCVVLKHYYGYSYDEVAKMTAFPSGTVKSKVHYALSQLRKELSSDEDKQQKRVQR
ncbi:RNA polymerase sigma factor SigY [Shouchella lonarensis]|uniref:RNA polymerase, sigma subunit, SigY n=1 Tax=Shouchella lonarensis TaxID=1464122 RepID=A0A1G6GPA0_9BACI|nr:RNA polymerase sigma factor SigY [Shouchella lonarensis]SDB83771.1 RNA polymerase, sigma subunit, SigY [Shouchella lonarensis]